MNLYEKGGRKREMSKVSTNALPLVLVLARAENGVIGKEGGLPWRIKSDMLHFKAVTMGNPVIMGRKTWQSLGKPLPGRANIVISRTKDFSPQGGHGVGDFLAALELAAQLGTEAGAEKICVIGGGEIYRAALPLADMIELTEVHFDAEGDTIVEAFTPCEWREVARIRHGAKEGETADHSIVTLVRR